MENMNLIRKVAWSFHRTTGIEYNELFSEAALAYCEAKLTYDPDKSALCTWAYHNMTNALKTFIVSNYNQNLSYIDDVSNQIPERAEMPFENSFEDLLEALPKDCRMIATELVNNPERYVGETPNMKRVEATPRYTRGLIYRDLREKGWKWARIWKGMKNMKICLNKGPGYCII